MLYLNLYLNPNSSLERVCRSTTEIHAYANIYAVYAIAPLVASLTRIHVLVCTLRSEPIQNVSMSKKFFFAKSSLHIYKIFENVHSRV